MTFVQSLDGVITTRCGMAVLISPANSMKRVTTPYSRAFQVRRTDQSECEHRVQVTDKSACRAAGLRRFDDFPDVDPIASKTVLSSLARGDDRAKDVLGKLHRFGRFQR